MNSHQRTPNTFKESFVVGNDSNASSIEAAAQVNSDANNLPLDLSFNLLPLDLSLKSIDREKKGDTCINVAADTTQAVLSCVVSGLFRRQSASSGFFNTIKKTEKSRFFQCKFNDCGKIFGNKYILQRHERIHTGERPYSCVVEHCGKSFRREHHLKAHELIHTGEKPYCCEACHISFNQLSNLNRHKRSHAHREAEALLEEKVSTFCNSREL